MKALGGLIKQYVAGSKYHFMCIAIEVFNEDRPCRKQQLELQCPYAEII